MKFSVIVPVYNVEKYILECLQSVCAQTFHDYEIILVDDGSTDKSGQLCDEYMHNFGGSYKVIHQQNMGLAAARNTGIEASNGEWLVFVDSDDYISTKLLETVNNAMNDFDADLYLYNFRRIDTNSVLGEKKLFFNENESVVVSDSRSKLDYYVDFLLSYKDGWEACNRVFKADIINKYRMQFQNTSEVFAEDLCFMMEYLLFTSKIYKICDILYFYRYNPVSLISNIDETTMLPKLYNLAKHFYFLSKETGNKLIEKNFGDIYFALLQHHVEFKTGNLSDNDLKKQLEELYKGTKYHKKWIRGKKLKRI